MLLEICVCEFRKSASKQFEEVFFLGVMVCPISSLSYLALISSLVEGLILQCLPRWPHIEEFCYFVSQSSRLPQRCKKYNLRDRVYFKKKKILMLFSRLKQTESSHDVLRAGPVYRSRLNLIFFLIHVGAS